MSYDPGVSAANLADDSVTFAKIQNITAPTLLGRGTAGAGDTEQISLGTNLSITGTTLNATGGAGVTDGDKGDIVVSSSGTVWSIDSAVATTAGRALIDDASASDQRTTLGLGTLATQSGTFSGTSSGTNTGDQTITLTGDVTGTGTGSFAATIANDAVTYAKLQNVTTARLLGRATAGSGDAEEITLGTNLSYTGTTLNATGGGTGNLVYTSAVASPPSSPSNGDVWFPSDAAGMFFVRISGAWVPRGPTFPLTEPDNTAFAWINQGGASVSTTHEGIFLSAPNSGATNHLRVRKKAAPSTPYTITIGFIPAIFRKDFNSCGFCWRESSSGKLVICSFGHSTTLMYNVEKWNDADSFSATYSSIPATGNGGGIMFLQASDDGTNRILRIVPDGQNPILLHSIGRTDFMTANEVGFFCNAVNSATPNMDVGMTLVSWLAV